MEYSPQTPATLEALLAHLAAMDGAHTCQVDALRAELDALRLELATVRAALTESGTGTNPVRRARAPLTWRRPLVFGMRNARVSSGTHASRRAALGKAVTVVAAVAASAFAEQVGTRTAFASPGTFTSSDGVTPAATATGTNGSDGLDVTSDTGYAINASATAGGTAVQAGASGAGIGVHGIGVNGYGVLGVSQSVPGIVGITTSGNTAVYGQNTSNAAGTAAVGGDAQDSGHNPGAGNGVQGSSGSGNGVYGYAGSGTGVLAQTQSGAYALYAENLSNTVGTAAVGGDARDSAFNPGAGNGVQGSSGSGNGVQGSSGKGNGVYGFALGTGNGVYGVAQGSGVGVLGASSSYVGVYGTTASGIGVYGESGAGSGKQALYGVGTNGSAGLVASSDSGYGVVATSTSGTGLSAFSKSGSAVIATSNGVGYGLYLTAPSGWALGCVGRIRVIGKAVGTVTLAGGSTSVSVNTSACSSSSNVILTPLADPGTSLWVTRTPGQFIVHASSAPSSDVPISFLLIN